MCIYYTILITKPPNKKNTKKPTKPKFNSPSPHFEPFFLLNFKKKGPQLKHQGHQATNPSTRGKAATRHLGDGLHQHGELLRGGPRLKRFVLLKQTFRMRSGREVSEKKYICAITCGMTCLFYFFCDVSVLYVYQREGIESTSEDVFCSVQSSRCTCVEEYPSEWLLEKRNKKQAGQL